MLFASVASVLVALLAHDGFRRWLKARAAESVSSAELQKLTEDLAHRDEVVRTHRAELDNVIAKLAIDFKRKTDELTADVKQTREHVDTRLGGAIAQLTPTGRGYNR